MSDLQNVLSTVEATKPDANKLSTLEAYHKQKMQDFSTKKYTTSGLREKIKRLEEKQNSLSSMTDEWRQLTEEIDLLVEEIRKIENDESRIDYFLSVGPLIFDYYDAQETVANGTVIQSLTQDKMPSNSVLSYFTTESPKIQRQTKHTASVIDTTEGMNRDKMLEKYLALVDPLAIKSGILPGSGMEPGWGICPCCEVEMTFYQNEAKLGCPECGHEEFILVDSEKPSYKDPPREITYFAYKKINHFNEWLAQFQAKESTDIPHSVIEAVLAEFKKERISDPKRIKKEKILQILQKLKLSKMYDHVQQIKNRVQQQMTTLVLSRENEERLQFMFKEIQPAFIKYCPKGRSNFLSYPYVLTKLCQLLEMDEFLPCFQLLKSREKLYQQDQVWQKICSEMGWEFIKSI